MDNKINRDCIVHKQICDLFCTYSKCPNKIICEKCVPEHLDLHPRQFIYHIENLCQIHAFDKVSKMKQILGKEKLANEARITKMYNPFEVLLNPLIARVRQFEKESKDLIIKELFTFLAKNKVIIQGTIVNKSDTKTVKTKPMLMVEEVISEVELINQKEAELKANYESFTWYADATEEMCASAQTEISKMVKTCINLLNNYFKIQSSKYTDKNLSLTDHHEESFLRKYMASHEVAGREKSNNLEMAWMQSKKEMLRKEQQLKRSKNEIKEKVTKIQQLHVKIQGLQQQLIAWEQRAEREEKQRREEEERQKKKQEQYLIKNDVISNGGQTLCLTKKTLEQKYLLLLFEFVPNPMELLLSQHNLTRPQMSLFFRCKSLQIFRMSFMPCDKQYLSQAFKHFENLHTIQLNSSMIDDPTLEEIAPSFPERLKHLHLIDNKITDQGLDFMFRTMKSQIHLESLFLSYNSLNYRALDVIKNYCFDLKVLHISKNPIKSKGAATIGKFLKQLEQLFIGDTGVTKQGFLYICRNCSKLKRLSLVATEISTDIISEVLLGLKKLEWLDISYSNLGSTELEKINKLKVFNRGVEIINQSARQ